jgi:L-ascorbate metabolism protein UlaG (beta-lactamase superfamily)
MLEKIGDVDILIVPVGGMDTVPARDVDELIRSIEPNIVIPMHYDMPDTTIGTGSSEEFCRETGCKIGEEVSKLSLKKKDLEGKSMEVIFLQKS